ncbi:MAG: hypothetical protein ABJB12_11875 [Pseudomonadota bacterium]
MKQALLAGLLGFTLALPSACGTGVTGDPSRCHSGSTQPNITAQ